VENLHRRSFLFLGAAFLAPMLTRRRQGQPDEFDFVIVGAGSAGCVLANRLSADPAIRVLLIEAGGPETDPLIAAPGKWTSLIGSTLDWNYDTEPEPGLGNRPVKWPRGKSYGGSSSINAMAYTRGHRACYDVWAQQAGPGWGHAALLPHFLNLEHNSRGASENHGDAGPLAVSDTTDPHAGHLAFLAAARERGFAADPAFDFDGAHQENGAGFYQKNIQDGRRHSAAAAFLMPVLGRRNLVVWPQTQALRLTVDRGQVTGVDVRRDGGPSHARVRRDVILAAGAIESPKLLMLSGIGPAADLRRLGVPVAHDLPAVGANLQDHLRVPVRWAARTPLAPSTVSAGLFIYSKSASARRPKAAPDIQFYVGRGLDTPDPFITLTVAMSQPASRGRISLRSADPLAPPLISPNYLSEPGDLEAMVEGVRLAQSLASASAYRSLRGDPVDPAANVVSDADVRTYIRRTADTIFHPVGTCRMGTATDSVVDPQLRVRGIGGLRVVDASVIPTNLNSQIHAACVVVGEMGAKFLLS
jgi:choline dehydrogenase